MMADWSPLRVTSPAGAHGRGAPRLELVHDVVLALADLQGQLLEGQDAVLRRR